jgi:putative CocE/NonD family hydrolase
MRATAPEDTMNNFAGWALALALSPAALAPLPTWAADEPGEKSSLREAFPADDFTLREFMVPMRDGTKLYTLVVTPKHTTGPMPILLQRTPYDATRFLGKRATTSLEVMRGAGFAGGGYIFVTQDIRGRHKSEGTYAMYRVPRGEFNRSDTDETTDAWDTIDWLVGNVAGHDGRVGIWGTSYPGWLVLAALRDPHPALVAAVASNPVVDVWKADDWFHWGAFRMAYAFEFIYDMETRPGSDAPYPYPTRDLYTWYLGLGSAEGGVGALTDARHEMWTTLMKYPAYGPYWKACAADQWFDTPPRRVPTLHVHGQWDQEDIYGAPAAYAALERHDTTNDANFLAIGPWSHGQHFGKGLSLGPLTFDEDTSKRFREDVLVPFLDHFLKGKAVPPPAPVTAFETGANRWRTYDRWPATQATRKLYLQSGGRLGFKAPTEPNAMTEYVSDPARPVPQAPRPFVGVNYDDPGTIAAWRRWLTEDQRFVDGRPDVVTWVSEPLEQDLALRGPGTAILYAETTGTDADWVVKLIDVFPDQDAADAERGGMQIMVTADIFRGRYRESLEQPKPLKPDTVLEYRVPLPDANHVFKRGHRLMVQVQSTWFPLYDRNPQTFVPSIMSAPSEAYRAQRHRIHHSATHATRLELPLVGP